MDKKLLKDYVTALILAGFAIIAMIVGVGHDRRAEANALEAPVVTTAPAIATVEPDVTRQTLTERDTELRLDRYEAMVAPTPEPVTVPQEEINAIAWMLSGEEYDNQHDRKIIIAQIACNRASDPTFPDTIIEVLEKGFYGYIRTRRVRLVSQDDYDVATEVLTAWYEGGFKPLSELRFLDHIGGKFVTATTYKEFLRLREEALG